MLQEVLYMPTESYCMTIIDMFIVTPITHYLGGALFIIVISAQIGDLAYWLSKHDIRQE